MSRLLTLHVGGIENGRERLFTANKGKRSEVIYELNNWLFDFLYANQLPIEQLPPRDDWAHSPEDPSFWSIDFPKNLFTIWVRTELVEFSL